MRTEAGVYIKKLLPSTLPGVPGGQKTSFFPQIRVYTEKLSLHIPFFAISGVLTHNFLYMPCFTIQTEQKRESLRNIGVLGNNYFIYTLPDQMMSKIGRPARGLATNRNCTPEEISAGFGQLPLEGVHGQLCRIWTASISRRTWTTLPDLDSFHQQAYMDNPA